MDEIIRFVQGKMSYDDFEMLTQTTPEIWDWIQSLLTTEMKTTPNHSCFSCGNWDRLQANNFSVKWAALSFGYEYGKSIAHSLISDLVEYHYPNIRRKTPIEESLPALLSSLKMDYLGGKEVNDIIEQALAQSFEGNAREQSRARKAQLRTLFHLTPRKTPQWVQFEDWPMGSHSPMEFVSQSRDGERVEYLFRDVDTEEERVIVQYY